MSAAGADRRGDEEGLVPESRAVLLTIAAHGGTGDSWVGGAMPECLLAPEWEGAFRRHGHLLTLADHLPDLPGGGVLSILLREGFAVYEPDTDYPDIRVACVVHPPSPPDRRGVGRLASIRTGHLVEIPPAAGPEVPYFVKAGGAPDLIQDAPRAARRLADDGFAFLLQVDDNGYPDGFVTGDYPFGFGALYVYGRPDGRGGMAEVVAGFTQFS